MNFSTTGHSSRKRSYCFVGAEPHDVLDAGAVVPAAVEDHHLAGGGEVLHVPLKVHLRLFPVRRRREGHHPEHARADALGQRLDGAAFPCPVAPLQHDDDAHALFFDPRLQVDSPTWSFRSSALYFFCFMESGRLPRWTILLIARHCEPRAVDDGSIKIAQSSVDRAGRGRILATSIPIAAT